VISLRVANHQMKATIVSRTTMTARMISGFLPGFVRF
jgi:hypothetical protein